MITSVIAWTALNDTIYAFQDLNDNMIIGVGSMAVRHNNKNAKLVSEGLAVTQVLALQLIGFMAKNGTTHYIGILIVSGLLSVVIGNVDLNDPKSCARWFQGGCHLVGVVTVCSFFSEYIVQL